MNESMKSFKQHLIIN